LAWSALGGYRRYLKTISDQHFAIDPDKIAEDNKFDGIFVLRTNTDLDLLQAAVDGGADLPHGQLEPCRCYDRSRAARRRPVRS
jgi:hypothetical protein